jgi:DNA-binding HxlR family transcriptional regulator
MKETGTLCTVEITLRVIGGRWKPVILYHLFGGTMRFSALRRTIPGISQKMLTQQLRELEKAGVVERKVYAEVPPRVEYRVSRLGESLKPVMAAMCEWGQRHTLARGSRVIPMRGVRAARA